MFAGLILKPQDSTIARNVVKAIGAYESLAYIGGS